MKTNKCKKTISGKHIWNPDKKEFTILNKHKCRVIVHYRYCQVCGLIDDTKEIK